MKRRGVPGQVQEDIKAAVSAIKAKYGKTSAFKNKDWVAGFILSTVQEEIQEQLTKPGA